MIQLPPKRYPTLKFANPGSGSDAAARVPTGTTLSKGSVGSRSVGAKIIRTILTAPPLCRAPLRRGQNHPHNPHNPNPL